MNDETFHLTPVDVRRYEFGTALRGYDKARVDQFRDQVADELERMARVTQELEAKARSFHEQLKAFRDRDKAINEALVSAQQMRSETREQAEREGQLILREAQAAAEHHMRGARQDAERIVEDAKHEIRRLERHVETLDRVRRTYIVQMKKMAEQHLAEIAATEHMAMPRPPAPLDPPAPSEPPAHGAADSTPVPTAE